MTSAFLVRKSETAERMQNPRVGDLFDEHLSFWMQVVSVDYGITVVELRPVEPAKRDAEGRYEYVWVRRWFPTGDAFRAAYAYSSADGYWITFNKNQPPIPADETAESSFRLTPGDS